ncbi:uncharacterized protein LOC109849640 isoform X2 [Asparagus officinalis]|uniref:uncharacterized protein LOC109849640 isoform X2 n=1 Tax=Asparagus officinalis TaxID=4686 RepID=UPI00098DE769|nr:uncharacterized protein LOC109849640 isoform X2 [Asparagus officinalis]
MSTYAMTTTTTKMKSPLFFYLLLLFLFTLSPNRADCKLELELGYSVSTVIDFNKYRLIPDKIHPFSLLPRHRSTDLLLLDSTDSVFYSLPIPISQESEVSVLAGRGAAGFSDGDKTAAMFNKPRSFAIDGKDNVYVADKINHAIRKISTSGMTTTIAGGYSQKMGNIDGPAQNASFSNDFDLVYVPTICALLISDRANGLIRQLDLKPEDCAQRTQAGLGVAPVSVIAVLCLLFGLVFGFAVRPFFATRTAHLQQPLYPQDMEALPDQSGASSSDSQLRRKKRDC